MICSPRTGPRTALTGDAGSLAEDQPLDCGTAPVALQQSRILCHSAQKLALLRSLARRCAPLSLFECYKASRFDRTATWQFVTLDDPVIYSTLRSLVLGLGYLLVCRMDVTYTA